jgi:hypothetical protein
MSLTTMSLKEANKIIEIYSNILSHSLELGKFEKFRYSELKGYDIFDIDNALKVTLAYRVFNISILNDIALEKLKKEAGENTVGVMCFFDSFAPDSIVQQLKKLDPANIYSRSEAYKIEGNFFESDLYKTFSKTESHGSFLDYCLSIEKKDMNYWENVYDRLGITWDDRDEYDGIYFIIQNKNLFFKDSQSIDIKDFDSAELIDIKQENVNEIKVPEKASFYSQHQSVLSNLFWVLFFCLGLIYTPIRIVIFCLLLIIGVFQIYFWLKEPIEHKWNFVLNLLYLILCVAGIFFKRLGLYLLALIIALWIIETIVKHLKKSKTNIKEASETP